MLSPEQRAKYRRILDAMSKRGTAVPSEFALKLLDALDAAEARLAAAYEGIGLDPEIEYTPAQIRGEAYGARMALEYAEARAVEFETAIRSVFEADHPIKEMHAERALRNLVYKDGNAQ